MKLFGTDGIRGKAGVAPLEPATVARVGAALVRSLMDGAAPHRFVIGRDTRESGEWIEQELARGLTSGGATVVSAGVVPTPAVAYLARTEGFDAGLVISASHNPYEDNGIKVFGGSGVKLTEPLEASVETAGRRLVVERRRGARRDRPPGPVGPLPRAPRADHGRRRPARRVADRGRLRQRRHRGDRAGVSRRRWVRCPADRRHPRRPQHQPRLRLDAPGRPVSRGRGAAARRLGIAFDGDGDRALFVDASGQVVDGDAMLLIAALHLKQEGRLPGDAVVATVMSNIGLEMALRERGISLVRTAVGDKYVMEEMVKRGCALGGEQSGHIIFADHLFTGDGLATALNVLRIMAQSGRELADLAGELVTYPQVLVNVRVKQRTDYLQVPAIAATIKRVESDLAGHGRLLIRYSGTEPLLRIMLEGKDQAEIRGWAEEIAAVVKEQLA